METKALFSQIGQDQPESHRRARLLIRLTRRLLAVIRGWEHRLRLAWLNAQEGVMISRAANIARTVQFTLYHEGRWAGGTISVAGGVLISHGVVMAPLGGSIKIEEQVFLGPYCVLYGNGGLNIGRNTVIAGHTFIVASNHNFDDLDVPIGLQMETTEGVTIGEDVWIGCGARILDGVSIGKGCVIGAGSVVNKSVPDYSVAVGVPARVVRLRTR